MVGMGMDVDYVADRATFYRETVVFPAAARRAVLAYELARHEPRRAQTLQPLLARTGDILIRLGKRLQAAAAEAAAHS
jgi:hypothetical protein